MTVPAPPAGPGVQPPFAAPPTEGRNARMWWGLGLGTLAAVLCCGAGIGSIAGLAITGVAAVNEQAHSAVEDYLREVSAGRYPEAYDLLCAEIRRQQSEREFTEQVSEQPKVVEYDLHGAGTINDELVVPADVTYTDGTSGRVNYRVIQDTGTGEMRFCGIAR